MAKHTVSKRLTKTWNIDESGDKWLLAKKARIQILDDDNVNDPSDKAAIFVDDLVTKSTLVVKGDITMLGGDSSAILIEGLRTHLTVAGTSRIAAARAIELTAQADSSTVRNNGVINAHDGIWVLPDATGIKIFNAGLIEAFGTGIGVAGAGSAITNTGDIFATNGVAMAGAGTSFTNKASGVIEAASVGIYLEANAGDAPLSVVNKGLVTGNEAAIYTFNAAVNLTNSGRLFGEIITDVGNDHISNSGRMVGDIALNAGNDVLVNTGRITATTIDLGDGDDIFTSSKGTVSGEIKGGAGDDTITLNSTDLKYTELVNGGTDHVFASASYTILDNIETLTLIGKAAIDATGNTLDNLITGNQAANHLFGMGGTDYLNGMGGNDMLTGGTGGDKFIFMAGGGADTITDFQDGVDVIDLKSFKFADFNQLDAKLAKVGNDAVLDFGDGDKLTITGGGGMTLTADDFLYF